MLVYYKVSFWDEIERTIKEECGLTYCANKIEKAVRRIFDYYGETNIISVEVSPCENIICSDELEEMLEVDKK